MKKDYSKKALSNFVSQTGKCIRELKAKSGMEWEDGDYQGNNNAVSMTACQNACAEMK